jgi:inner membrane protein
VPVALLLGALLVMGVTPPESFAVLVIVAGMFAWLTSRTTASMRAGMAFIAAAIVVLVFVAASREARAASRDALRPYVRGRLVDVILTPNPASPMCWGLIGVDAIDADGEYVLWRGTLSLMPSIKPPVTCASHRLVPAGGTRTIANGGVVLREEIRQPIARLRRLSDECWTRAWLRFGRAPVIEGDRIFDLRFGERATQEFTYMTLRSDRRAHACPSYVPDWEMPRRDLFDR